MANNGRFTTNAYEGRHLVFSWSIVQQSIDKNQTTIRWDVRGAGGNNVYWYMVGNFKVVLDGTTVYRSETRIKLFVDTVVASGTYTFTHQQDGTRRFNASMEAGIYAYAVNCRGNSSFELQSIARATVPSINRSVLNYGEVVSIQLPRASSHFTHTLQVSVDGKLDWINIATNVATSFNWLVPKNYARYLPLSSDKIKVRAITYSGNSVVGTKEAASLISPHATDDMKPVVNITLSDPMNHFQTFGGFVKGQSKIKAIVSERLYENTTVATRALKLNGITYQSNHQTSDVINALQQKVEASVTDGRGMVGTATTTPVIYDWWQPRIVYIACNRCEQNGTLNESGNYVKLEYDVRVANVNNKNRKSLRYGFKKQQDKNYTFYSIPMNEYSRIGYMIIPASGEHSWDIAIEVSDSFRTVMNSIQVGTAYVLMDFHKSGKGLAFGKVSEQEKVLDIASDWNLKYKNQVMNDFIIEQGEKDHWIYRKWHSGIGECFKTIHVTLNFPNKWGDIYMSGPIKETDMVFPFTFISLPTITTSLSNEEWGGCIFTAGAGTKATSSRTGMIEVGRGLPTTNGKYTIHYQVIGKWK